MPSSRDLAYLPLTEAAKLVEEKEVSPVDLTDAVLDRIEDLNPKVNAYNAVFKEEAIEAAKKAEAEIQSGRYLGPLHGIPLAVKDIYESGPTNCGSKTLEHYVAEEDATSVTKLKEAGAVIVGKTATYEFAYGFPTRQSYYKPTLNPYNFQHEAGGSSSGSAAACAAGMAYGAMGSCTGGSIRWPAQCCGIVGLKATYGRVSRAGVYPLSWSLDHTGPLTRTVADAAAVLQGCAGYDPKDPASADVPVPNFSEKIGRDIKGMKVGLLRNLYEDNCDPKVMEPYSQAIPVFQELGAEVVDVDCINLRQLQAIEWPTLFSDAAAIHIENVRRRGDDYNPHAKLFIAYGLLVSSVYYLQAQRVRAQVRDDLLRALDNVDVLVSPTAGFQVPPVLDESPGLSIIAGDFSVYTPMFNITGFPAIQVPCGFDSDGLPVGLQIAGKPFDEATIVQVAHAYEQASPWRQRQPDL